MSTALPALAPVGGPVAWRGSEIDFQAEGMHRLSPSDIAEIDAALHHLLSLGDLDFPDGLGAIEYT